MNTGTLFVVATPIGNLSDITLRALETLKSVDAVYCEDTRVTSKLMARYSIKKPLFRLDAVTERAKAAEVARRIDAGENIALVSDAGTPAISDPGAFLVSYIREACGEKSIVPIPGVSAAAAALSVSGLTDDHFLFLGFPPHKKGRQKFLDEAAASKTAVVLYESPHRMEKLLEELAERIPARRIILARELTKLYEEIAAGPAAEILARFKNGDISGKGEFVVVIAP